MKRVVCMVLAAAWPLVGFGFEPGGSLDGKSGHIHKLDLQARTFELLKETEYDPKTDIGQSRFTVHWEDPVRIVETLEVKDFDRIDGPVMALLEGIRPADREAYQAGKPFEVRVMTLFTDPSLLPPVIEGVPMDANRVIGRFTPGNGLREGVLEVAGKSQPVALRNQHWRIYIQSRLSPEDLAKGFWRVTLQGQERDGLFIATTLEVGRLPDPRLTDDPKLPRVLVIGDSISMNYHESAKAALAGVANYHRCEGNAFSSAHGVRNAELWMGDFNEPGFQWDVIQFNHGLHDLKQAYDAETDTFGGYAVPLDEYRQNLEKMIAILKRSGAKLVWCTTTPVPNDNKGTYARRKGAAAEFNAAALEVMKRHPEVLVNDLHGMISGSRVFDAWRTGNDVHFYRESEQLAIGEAVAAVIRKALGM